MAAPKEILDLVERFDRNRDAYRSAQYNETQLRREFLDPFFIALGWDVENRQGFAEAYKDVIHEDAIKIGGYTKAPDYCFRIGGTRKFFVEAKKPAVDIVQDTSPAFQLRRYAWSAKLPLSILSSFEELAVYDSRIKPVKTDKASSGRIKLIPYNEYVDRWDEIAAIFSRDAIMKGAFDKYAETTRKKKGTAEVDDAFLSEIESWRDVLARNLALRNPKLTHRELNFAVQRTIDRIIFLRICEDRGIEPEGRLLGLTNGPGMYERLVELYRQADDRYNSGLFHFRQEKGRTKDYDSLTPGLKIDDKVLKEILRSLYYPDSPYEFSILPADILGHVYEQFLGKVIRLTAGHQAKIEDKPEVKKAGGVFYTPTYIVEYIVRNTVDKLLEGKTPRAAAKLTILDPACGSGSFLIGAYQRLLDWHRDWYVDNGKEKWAKGNAPALYQGTGGEWRLTTTKKKEILLNNIYGVDIDSQAVEVTKLSLLLKVLEGESEQTLASQFFLFHKRALPDLGNNIKCGNSLIGPDFYENQQLSFLDEEERLRLNIFDWDKEFPQIFRGSNPGFDSVIGNPPYIRIQALKEWAPLEVEFYKKRYVSASKGNYDIYVVFVEKGLSLLNNKGRLGFILPHKFFNAQYGEPLRGLISKGKHLSEVVHFGDKQVFAGATTYTCLMFLGKTRTDGCRFEKVEDLDGWRAAQGRNGNVPIPEKPPAIEGTVSADIIGPAEWNFTVGKEAALLEQLRKMPTKLEHVTSRIFQGIKTSADKIYIVEEIGRGSRWIKIFSREKQKEYRIEPSLLHPLVKGGDSKRYQLSRTHRLIIFPYAKKDNGLVDLIQESVLRKNYPLTWEYFTENKGYLENREDGKMRGPKWYGYGRIQALDVIDMQKIFTPDIADCASFSLDETGEVFFTGGVSGGYGILVLPEYSRDYILGLLNSKLLEWFIRQTATRMRGGYFSFESRFIRHLPIRTTDFSDPAGKSRHDRMVQMVEQMLSLNKQLTTANTDHEKTALQRQIDATDRQIDLLVYELYELTDKEIRIVEESRGGL